MQMRVPESVAMVRIACVLAVVVEILLKGRTKSEHLVARKQAPVLLQVKRAVILGMPWRMQASQRRPLEAMPICQNSPII